MGKRAKKSDQKNVSGKVCPFGAHVEEHADKKASCLKTIVTRHFLVEISGLTFELEASFRFRRIKLFAKSSQRRQFVFRVVGTKETSKRRHTM